LACRAESTIRASNKATVLPVDFHYIPSGIHRTHLKMTSIDDLFRKPSASGKRKLESPSSFDPTQLYNKSAKLSNGSSARTNGRSTTVEDEVDPRDLDDIDAGPALPPEDDVPDDEEGRFFGGGITSEEKKVLDFIDAREGEEREGEEVIDIIWLRKMALNFEKRVSKNAEMRAKFEGSPERYVRLPCPALFLMYCRHTDDFIRADLWHLKQI
jgi:Catenin-beta-like, Arm-motif containing nuclear